MLENSNIRTDLAVEAHEMSRKNRAVREAQDQPKDEGVIVEEAGTEDVKVTRVQIVSPQGEQELGKPMGNYITLDVPKIKTNHTEVFSTACNILAQELRKIIRLSPKSSVLIVGLGNWNITPDALGPKVVNNMMVTRHLLEYAPDALDENFRSVSSIAPGVLGITGIETGEIVKGVVEKVKPDIIIAIDALASRKMERISTTIQIADTGISPGSGVGNKRMELSKNTLGIPVVAIGVPTVVDAATMANDTIDLVMDNLLKQTQNGSEFFNMLNNLDRNEKYQLIKEVLSTEGNFIVTPKEIDEVIERVAKIVAYGINMALHENISIPDIENFIH